MRTAVAVTVLRERRAAVAQNMGCRILGAEHLSNRPQKD
jgi:hypothetical protein